MKDNDGVHLRINVDCINCTTLNNFNKRVSIQPALAMDFWPLESRHFVSVLRYLIQFLSLCSFVDCGFRVRVSSRVRVSFSFIFSCIFRFWRRLKKPKLEPGRLPPWVSSVQIALHRWQVRLPGYDYFFASLKGFPKCSVN